jgi:hypothetical protein
MHRGRVWKRPRTSNPVVPGSWRRSRNFPPRSRAENLQFSIQMSNSREVKSSRSRGADASEFWRSPHSEIEERAGKAGCRLTFLARVQQKKHAAVTTGSTGSSGLPCTMLLTLSFALPGDRAFLPLSSARSSLADLMPASGCQDHTTSPSAAAPFVREKNARRLASIAARLMSGDDWPKRPSFIEAG